MENKVIELSEEQRKELERFTRTGVHNARLITRAKTILALDRSNKKEHMRMGRICEQIGVSRKTVYNTRQAFLKAGSIEEFLRRKKRETPPVEPKITGEVEAHIVAMACSDPPEGCARWTQKLIAHKSVELQYIDSISDRSVGRVLKKRNISLT